MKNELELKQDELKIVRKLICKRLDHNNGIGRSYDLLLDTYLQMDRDLQKMEAEYRKNTRPEISDMVAQAMDEMIGKTMCEDCGNTVPEENAPEGICHACVLNAPGGLADQISNVINADFAQLKNK